MKVAKDQFYLPIPLNKQCEYGMALSNPPLAQQVYDAIFLNPLLNHRRMHVCANKGRVTIKGQVESFFEKQVAQESLRNLEGVELIDNRLEVTWQD